MRKELFETEQIEKYLLHQLSKEEKQQFETNMLRNPLLADKVDAQLRVYQLIRIFSRRQERNRLEMIYRRLLQETSFAQQLKNIFA